MQLQLYPPVSTILHAEELEVAHDGPSSASAHRSYVCPETQPPTPSSLGGFVPSGAHAKSTSTGQVSDREVQELAASRGIMLGSVDVSHLRQHLEMCLRDLIQVGRCAAMISQLVPPTAATTSSAAVELVRVEGPPLFHGTDPGAKNLVQVYRLEHQGVYTFLPGDACRIFSGIWEERHNDVSPTQP
jgi:hypothetical protein